MRERMLSLGPVGGVPIPIRVDGPDATPSAALVLAHGAGAGMDHPFLATLCRALVDRGIGVVRYSFPYRVRGSRRPDPAPVLTATVEAVVAWADRELDLPLFAGGKSMGGRMSSTAQSQGRLPGVRGLVFFGFPLHPARRPGTGRADHLARVTVPMLFLQGTRDALAELSLLEPICRRLGPSATLHVVEGADHGFAVLKRSGRSGDQVVRELADTTAAWIGDVVRRG